MSHRLIYVTTPTRDAAVSIARALLDQRLIACANIIPGALSLYRWEGRVVEDGEVILIAKTKTECAPRVIEKIRGLHSFTCPCILALPVTDGNPAFLEWISGQCED